MIDLLFVAENRAALKAVVTSGAFKEIVGDLTDPDTGDLAIRHGRYVSLPGAEGVYFPPGSVVVVPGDPPVTDPLPWFHLRLHGEAEARDEKAGTGDDLWDRSRLIQAIRDNAVLRKLGQLSPWDQVPAAANVTVAVMALPNGDRFGVIRGKQMADNGLLFHEFLGGNTL